VYFQTKYTYFQQAPAAIDIESSNHVSPRKSNIWLDWTIPCKRALQAYGSLLKKSPIFARLFHTMMMIAFIITLGEIM